MAYPFVAAPDNWSRNGKPIKAIVVHMAEGGGTVSWLTRNDGNSSHYVVEYTGRIVQMVYESRAAGSINPNALRTNNDAAYSYLGESVVYGATAAKKCLGTYWSDPNAVVIAIEVEGYAATGPNAKQRAALVSLIKDIRSRRGALPVLGHRDFQNYKACPGKRIPWVDYGHHAVATKTTAVVGEETPTVAITGSTVPEVPTRVYLKAGAWLYTYSDHRVDAQNTQLSPNRPLLLTRFIDADTYAVAYEPSTADSNNTSVEKFVKVVDIEKTEVIPLNAPAPADTTPFDQADIDAAVATAVASKDATITSQATTIADLKTKLSAAQADDADYTALKAALKKAVA